MKVEISKKFKQKDLIIKKIGMAYRKVEIVGLGVSTVREEDTLYLAPKKENYYSEVKMKVDYILSQLDEQLSKIIYNEYMVSKKQNWWMYFYSKSTYYRLKNKAMDSFLEWWYA